MNKFFSAIGVSAFLLFAGLMSSWEAEYSRLAVCTNRQGTVYTFTDNNGNDWEWEREPGETFELGYAYRLVMDNNHTPFNKYDDTIKKIKKN